MADVPTSVISNLISLDGYEQMLEIDRITVEYSVSEDELMQLMASAKGESPEPKLDPISNPSFARSKSVDYDLEPPQSQKDKPEALQDAHRFRMEYDPSESGRARQSQVDQAIVCSQCRSPLGIPSIRPIRVTCPHCMYELFFES
tara:strand:+ start:819 stop:1253 length:435 start_codon:yes stop_codon:yes gene_type:complete